MTATLGVDDLTFHSCRHTFAPMLVDGGRTVDFVAQQLGHEGPAFTRRTYITSSTAARQRRHAQDELDAEYGALLRGRNA
ncbi:MAG TPA: tyrosine-type recombinase/integrase [Solirubrobacteraceae bacterium]|nr:tyrosine-type recombinase/integrase [Solirubrobacteraceae bacterium]